MAKGRKIRAPHYTPRQVDILRLVALGYTRQMIADYLGNSYGAVGHSMSKMSTDNGHMPIICHVLHAWQTGFLDLEPIAQQITDAAEQARKIEQSF